MFSKKMAVIVGLLGLFATRNIHCMDNKDKVEQLTKEQLTQQLERVRIQAELALHLLESYNDFGDDMHLLKKLWQANQDECRLQAVLILKKRLDQALSWAQKINNQMSYAQFLPVWKLVTVYLSHCTEIFNLQEIKPYCMTPDGQEMLHKHHVLKNITTIHYALDSYFDVLCEQAQTNNSQDLMIAYQNAIQKWQEYIIFFRNFNILPLIIEIAYNAKHMQQHTAIESISLQPATNADNQQPTQKVVLQTSEKNNQKEFRDRAYTYAQQCKENLSTIKALKVATRSMALAKKIIAYCSSNGMEDVDLAYLKELREKVKHYSYKIQRQLKEKVIQKDLNRLMIWVDYMMTHAWSCLQSYGEQEQEFIAMQEDEAYDEYDFDFVANDTDAKNSQKETKSQQELKALALQHAITIQNEKAYNGPNPRGKVVTPQEDYKSKNQSAMALQHNPQSETQQAPMALTIVIDPPSPMAAQVHQETQDKAAQASQSKKNQHNASQEPEIVAPESIEVNLPSPTQKQTESKQDKEVMVQRQQDSKSGRKMQSKESQSQLNEEIQTSKCTTILQLQSQFDIYLAMQRAKNDQQALETILITRNLGQKLLEVVQENPSLNKFLMRISITNVQKFIKQIDVVLKEYESKPISTNIIRAWKHMKELVNGAQQLILLVLQQ